MSLLLLFGNHPTQGSSAGQATVPAAFLPGRVGLAAAAVAGATVSGSLTNKVRFKQSTTQTATSTASTMTATLPNPLAVGDLVVVIARGNYGANTCTATGVTFSFMGSDIFGGKVTSGGATTVVLNWTAGTPMNMHVLVFANADFAFDDSWGTNTGTSNNPNSSVAVAPWGGPEPMWANHVYLTYAYWTTAASLTATNNGWTSPTADIGATTTFRSVASYKLPAADDLNPGAPSWSLSASATWTAGGVVALVPTQTAVPPAPSQITCFRQNGGVDVEWSFVPGATNGYRVYQDGSLKALATLNQGSRYAAGFVSAGLAPGSTHTFTVSALNAFGEGPQSQPITVTVIAAPAWNTRNKYPATNPPTVASTTQSTTFTSTALSSYAVAVLLPDATTTVTGVTGAGATWQRAGRATNAAGLGVELWYALRVPGGADTITVTVSASVLFNIDVLNVSTAYTVENANTSSGSGTSIFLPITNTSADGAFWVGVVGQHDTSASSQSGPNFGGFFADNAMLNGSGGTVSSRNWFIGGLASGTDPRNGGGLSLTDVNTSWAAAWLTFSRAWQLAASAAGTSTGTGSLTVTASGGPVAISGSSAGHAATAGRLGYVQSMTSAPAGHATATAAVKVTHKLTSVLAGVASTQGTMGATRRLASAVIGGSTVAIAVKVTFGLRAPVAGTAIVIDVLGVTRRLAGATAGVSNVNAGTTSVLRALSAGSHSQGMASASLSMRRGFASSLAAGMATVAVDMLVGTGGLTGAATGAGVATGASVLTLDLGLTVHGQAVVAGAAALSAGAVAYVAGTGAAGASLAVQHALVASVAGAAIVAGAAGAGRQLTAAVSATSVVAASVQVRRLLVGAAGGTGVLFGMVRLQLSSAGAVTGVAGASGATEVQHPLVAAVFGRGVVAGQALIQRQLGAILAGGAAVTGTALRAMLAAGSSAGAASSSAGVTPVRRLTGSSTGAATSTGATAVRRGLSTRSAGTGRAAGGAQVRYVVAGAAAGHAVFRVSGGSVIPITALAQGAAGASCTFRIRRGLESDATSASVVSGGLRATRRLTAGCRGQASVVGTSVLDLRATVDIHGAADVLSLVGLGLPLAGGAAGWATVTAAARAGVLRRMRLQLSAAKFRRLVLP